MVGATGGLSASASSSTGGQAASGTRCTPTPFEDSGRATPRYEQYCLTLCSNSSVLRGFVSVSFVLTEEGKAGGGVSSLRRPMTGTESKSVSRDFRNSP